MGEIKYEDRIVVYFDLLGFKNYIKASETDDNYFKSVKNVIMHIYNEKKKHDESNDRTQCSDGLELSIFSDNVVMSVPFTEDVPVVYLICMVGFMQRELLQMGYFVRGGLSVGKLYHKDSIVFGPALVDAVKIEQTTTFPRISMTAESYAKIDNKFKQKGEYEYRYDKKDFDKLLQKYSDEIMQDYYFLDFLSQEGEMDSREEYCYFLSGVKKRIKIERQKINDKHILDKYTWFEIYLKKVCLDKKIDFCHL